jgi:hypothetical protein
MATGKHHPSNGVSSHVPSRRAFYKLSSQETSMQPFSSVEEVDVLYMRNLEEMLALPNGGSNRTKVRKVS